MRSWSSTAPDSIVSQAVAGIPRVAAFVAPAAVLALACASCSGAGSVSGPTNKVIVIGIDGVRPDVLAEVATPNLDALISRGAYTDRAQTGLPSVSGPGWSSLLIGVWPDKHGVTSNDFHGHHYADYPDFLTRIETVRADLETFVVADWLPLVGDDSGGPVIGDAPDTKIALDGYELGWAEADEESAGHAVRAVRQGDPDAMFVYLGDPDETSHQHGSIGVEYRAAIEAADERVGRIVSAIESRSTFDDENWLILVSTDHGRTVDGGHGGDSAEERTIFFLASGPSAEVGPIAEPVGIVDVAVTALAHLGLENRPEWNLDGKVVGLRR